MSTSSKYIKSVLLFTEEIVDFYTNSSAPTNGTITTFVELIKAFEAAGVKTYVYSDCEKEYISESLEWKHHSKLNNDYVDLKIVTVRPLLLEKVKKVKSKQTILWIHNEAKYLLKWKQYKYVLKYWPTLLFSGKYHQSTLPWFIPCKRKMSIEFGLSESILQSERTIGEVKQRAIFTSNPLRSLRWLVDIWSSKIHPFVPSAELIIYSGSKTYGIWGESVKVRMDKELNYARGFESSNVFVKDPIPKSELFKEVQQSRLMLYRGDRSETFCLAVAEAQALGVPCVVGDLGAMKERVQYGITGYVTNDEEAFARYTIQLFQDDILWNEMSKNAANSYKNKNWTNFVDKLERMLQK